MPMDVVPSGLISDKIELSTSADPRLINFDPPAPKTCEYCGTLLYARAFIHVVGERVKEVKWLPGYSRCSCRDSEKEEMADYKRKNNICSDDLGNDFVSRRKRIKEIFLNRVWENAFLEERLLVLKEQRRMGQRLIFRKIILTIF